MSTPLTLDIETVPLAASLTMPYPASDREPPSNYRMPDAIANWRIRDENEWRDGLVKQASLNPRLGRVLCLGYIANDAPVESLYATSESEEADLLREFWSLARQADGKMITWNGSWDLRFLVIRSLANHVKPLLPSSTIRDWFRRYTVQPHFDVRAVLLNWDTYKGGEGLDEWSSFFGIPNNTAGMDGNQVYAKYLAGLHAEIASYCEDEVTQIAAIHDRIQPFFGSTAHN